MATRGLDSGNSLGAGEVANRYRSVETMESWQLKRIADALEKLIEIEERKNAPPAADS